MTPTIRHEKLTEKNQCSFRFQSVPQTGEVFTNTNSEHHQKRTRTIDHPPRNSMFQKYSRRKGRPSLITQAFEDGEPNASPCSESLNFWDLCGNRRTVRDYSYFCSAGNRRHDKRKWIQRCAYQPIPWTKFEKDLNTIIED